MENQSRQLTPEQDALEHIVACRDKPFLEEIYIDAFKGRGVFTHKAIKPSEFVVEYRGNIFPHKDARPKKKYADTLNNYLFEFSWKGEHWCIDASKEDRTLGRLVNDDNVSPNCEMKKIFCDGKPHLCLFAVKEISPGEEITYSYGDSSYPWRSKESYDGSSTSYTDFKATSTPRNKRFEESEAASSFGNSDSDDDNDKLPEGDNSPRDLESTQKKLQPDDTSCTQQEVEAASSSEEYSLDEDYVPSKAARKKSKDSLFTSKNYCYVCGAGVSKITRHFLRHADEEPEIAEAIALPKHSKERKKLLGLLRNRGNYKHNQEVLRNNSGKLKMRRRPTKSFSAKELMHCPYCKAMFKRNDMWRHAARCHSRTTPKSATEGRTNVLTEIALAESPFTQTLPSGVRKMLLTMKQDDIASAVQNDFLLIQLAQSLSEKFENNPDKYEYVRQKLREMGRLLIALHEKSIFSFEDAIKPKNFHKVIATVKHIAGFNKKMQRYNKPSLALRLGNSLKRIGTIALTSADGNERTIRNTKQFVKLCVEEWSELSHTALASLRKVSNPSTIPFTRDVQLFYTYLETTSASATESLKMDGNTQAYIALCRVTLSQSAVLNKCAPEVSKITLKAFQERDDTTQVLSKHFIRINILSKTGQNVAVLLTSELVNAMTLLVSKREACGVHQDNPFLFAKPNSSSASHFHGANSIRAFSSLCHAKNPEHFISVNLHKHIARVFQFLNLENDELGHLAKLLGHDIRADRDYYRLPEAAVELAQVAKLLLAMEKGSLERFKGNSLEEIEIENELEPDVEQGNPETDDTEDDNEDSDICLQQRSKVEDSAGASSSAESCCDDEYVPDGEPSSDDSWTSNKKQHVKNKPDSDSPKERSLVRQPVDASCNQQEDEADNSSDDFTSDEEAKPRSRAPASRNYCYVCGKAYSKITRHLFTHRNEEPDVAKVFALPIYSKERNRLLVRLRNKGNYKHNEEVLKTSCGELKVKRRSTNTPADAKKLALCLYCKCLHSRKHIWRHMQRCSSKKSLTFSTTGRSKALTLVAAAESSDTSEISSDVKEMLKMLRKDEISSLVANDPLILQVAQHLWHTSEGKTKRGTILQRIRIMGRLLLMLRKDSICSLEDAIKPQNFSKVVEAVRELAGFNVETKSCHTPSLMIKLGNSLRKIGDIKLAKALKEDADKETMQEVETFIKLCTKEWGHTAVSRVKNTPTIPLIHDVQLFYQYMEKTAASAIESITLYESPPVYSALLRVTVAQVSLLSKNVVEVSKVTLKSFNERDETERHDDGAVCQSQLDKILSKPFLKINVKSNRGKKLTMTLTPKLLAAITLLVSKREACGVHKDNPFLFATPTDICTSFFQGQQSITIIVSRCSAKDKVNLRSVYFRKYILRVFQILSLNAEELDELAKLLGRDIRTDGEYYQTPEAAVDIAKISELLSALENGTLERFEGKSLEEIEIGDELEPNLEQDIPENSDAEEDNDRSESSLRTHRLSANEAGHSTKKNRRVSSSRKRGRGRRRKQESENEESELNDEVKDDGSEEMPESCDVDTPEKTLPRNNEDATKISFSDDDEDMNVDFDVDMDTDDDDVRNEENDGDGDTDGPGAVPLIPDLQDTAKQDNDSGNTKTTDGSPCKNTTVAEPEETMDIDAVNHVEKEGQKKRGKRNNWMEVDSRSSSAVPNTEKKNKLSAAVTGMKELKILIPKLDIEKFQTPVHISKLPSVCNSADRPVNNQPVHGDNGPCPTSTASADIKNKPSNENAMQMTCSRCKKAMMKGQTAYQKKGFTDVFCSKKCLFDMFPTNKPATKTCHYCHKAIMQPLDLIMAAVDIKGTMKDFCSVACLCSFKFNTVSTQKPQSVCGMCNKPCTTTCELTLNEAVHKFCSDSCLEDFRRDNTTICENCSSTCHNKPLMLMLDEETKTICGDECLNEFKEKINTTYQCTMCHTSRLMSDMVNYKSEKNAVELFCSRTCVASYKLQPNDVKKSSVWLKRRIQLKQKINTEVTSDSTAESDKPTILIADSCVVCSHCGKELPEGETLYQPRSSREVFCSPSCLSERHPHISLVTKKCYNCFQVILRPHNIILAPVDDSGTVKELCSHTCLSSVNSKRNTAAPKPPPQIGPRSECKICCRFCICTVRQTLDGLTLRICSDACFINYHKFNNLPVFICDVCSSVCSDKRLMLKREDGSNTICGEECLVKFKEKIETPQLCPTCQTSHQMSDMVENKNDEGRLDFFCSNRCMKVHTSRKLFTVPEKKSPKFEDVDIKEVKPSLPNMDFIKEEPIDEEYNQNVLSAISTEDIKDEPKVAKEDLKMKNETDSFFSLMEDSTSTSPTSAAPTVTHMEFPTSCSNCKMALMDGETVYQRKGHADIFCSSSCLLKFYQMKQAKKTCHFCLQVITQPQDVLQAPVDTEETVKDFCSQTCLSSFNYKIIMSTRIPIAPVASQSQCSMCSRYCISKREIIQQDVVHKICSDPCFLRFCNMNNLSICENCCSHCNTPVMLKMEGGSRKLCSAECLAQFKQKTKTLQPCTMCCSPHLMSDMVENKNSDDVVELFCSSSCVMASKIRAVSASGSSLNCDKCGKTTIPACHLAMSDASIRNFCTLTCAMAFKKTQNAAANPPAASDQTHFDFLKPPEKLPCAQCRRILKTAPKVVQKKGKINFVCSLACSEEFKKVNNITGKCECCKNERIIREIKRVDNKDCYFCSEGCMMLFSNELEKKWGEHCRSCVYCLSISKTAVTAQYKGSEEQFCSEECNSKYNMLFCHVARCDTCSREGKLRQSLPMPGEIKHFCDIKCLLHFCNKKVNTVSSPPRSAGAAESSPVIANVISLAGALNMQSRASASSAQHVSVPDIQTKVVGHASVQTVPKELKNKSMLCTPLAHNKGVSCTTQTVDTGAQTDKFVPRNTVLPVPVPVYVPVPMNMYSQYTPKPLGLPLLLPVPIFLPVTPGDSDPTVKSRKKSVQPEPHKKTPAVLAVGMPSEPQPSAVEIGEGRQSSPSPAPAPSLLQETVGEVHNENKVHKLQQLFKAAETETFHRDPSKPTSGKHRKLKGQSGIDAWKRWIQWRESQTNLYFVSSPAVTLNKDVLQCSATELNEGLVCFITEVKRPDGQPYPPDRLFYLCLSIQQYLFENGRMENIFSDLIYNKFSEVLAKILRGFNPSVTASGYIHSRVEEEFLWDCKQLGAYSPIVLLNTLLFFCCKYFGFTTVEQHRQLSFAHLMRCTKTNLNHTKTTFLRFYPPISVNETESDGVPAKKRKNESKGDVLEMLENRENPLRCPVRLYEFYLSKCSESVRQRTDLFYLQPDRSCVPNSPLWFSSAPLDNRTLETMLVRILAVRELQGGDRRGVDQQRSGGTPFISDEEDSE